MSTVSIYLSAPLGTPVEDLKEVSSRLGSIAYDAGVSHDIKYYVEGTEYNSKHAEEADVMVILSKQNKFGHEFSKMTSGVNKEVSNHFSKGKRVLITYRTSTRGIMPYAAKFNHSNHSFEGVQNSVSIIGNQMVKAVEERIKKESEKARIKKASEEADDLLGSPRDLVESKKTKEMLGYSLEEQNYSLLLIC